MCQASSACAACCRSAMALTADETRLYVACAGLNAVAVIDLTHAAARRLYPGRLVSRRWSRSSADDRTLLVSSAKGLGSGPNGGRGSSIRRAARIRRRHDAGHAADLSPVPDARAMSGTYAAGLANTYARRVRRRDLTLPTRSSTSSSSCKENRTFDQVFGQRRGVERRSVAADLGMRRARARARTARVLDRASTSRRTIRRSPIASPSVRQLLLRQRPVEHRASLGRRRLSERVGRGERALAHRGAPVQLARRAAATSTARARRCCPRTTTRPARSGST